MLVALLLLAILVFNFLLAFRFAQESFFERLEEKALAVANNHAGGIRTGHSRTNSFRQFSLPSEVIYLFSKGSRIFSSGKGGWSPEPELLENIASSERVEMVDGIRHTIGFTVVLDGEKLIIVASALDEVGSSKLRNLAWSMAISFLIFLVFVVLVGNYLSRKALEPIKYVISQVRRITAQNLNSRVAYEDNRDEIAQLSNTFNSMLERLEESFRTQADFVRNSSHELRNPLAAMIGQAEIALNRDRDSAYYKEVVQAMYQESLRMKHIVNSLLQLSRLSQVNAGKFAELLRLDELLFDVVENMVRTDQRCSIKVHLEHLEEKEALVNANRGLLEIALVNILDNACKYSGYEPVRCVLDYSGNSLILSIEDNGIGMQEEEIRRISEPFYRSSRVRSLEGQGIGMAVATRVLQVYGIEMKISSTPGKGTRIDLTFPANISPRHQQAEG